MLQSLTQTKMMVSPQTDSTETVVRGNRRPGLWFLAVAGQGWAAVTECRKSSNHPPDVVSHWKIRG